MKGANPCGKTHRSLNSLSLKLIDVRGWVGAMRESISKLCSDFLMSNFLGTLQKFIGFSERAKRFLPISLTILREELYPLLSRL